MSKERLRQVRHGSDSVEFVNGILVAVVVDYQWQDGLWWGGDAGTNAMTLEARVTWDGYKRAWREDIAARAQSAPCSKLLRAQAPR